MEAKIIQFRRGRKVFHKRHFLIEIPKIKSRKAAEKFVDKKVKWTSPAGKIIKGRISSPHGNKGVVRAIFEKGLPGQAIPSKVEILDSKSKDKKSNNKQSKKEASK